MNEEIQNTHESPEEIAIVGLTGRFPGANSPEELWEVLKEGRETISRFASTDDPAYVPARGVLSGATTFDAELFGMNPNEALLTDPQQRVFLQAAWEALESAGVDPKRFSGAIGVYAGMSNNSYFSHAVQSRPDLSASVGALTTMMGNEKDYLATRVAYKLNLKGPAISVYTACSTSLVAVCQAVASLLSYQCDLAIAGGVSITFPQETGYSYHEGGILSPDGHCRSFDESASGTVFSQGVGAVALKRLSEALADGDTIHAIIKSAALNNDGDGKVSFTAPSIDGQAEAVALAHALAGIAPRQIGFVEAHGTATPLGDPIEIAGLTQAFRTGTDDRGFCALGALKSNIGHLDAAAGIAGLIKTILVLKNKQFPPVVHFSKPNPKLNLETSPFFVPKELSPWIVEENTPRYAGVSSFGVGGTNAHVILEEAPEPNFPKPSRKTQLLTLSAKNPDALERVTDDLANFLDVHPEASLADAAFTLNLGRQELETRRTLTAATPAEAAELLRSRDKKRVFSGKRSTQSVAFLFPGQGAQAVNMGRALYESEAPFRDALTACAEILRTPLGLDLRDVLYPTPEKTEASQLKLTETWITQPALFAVEYALARLWQAWGIAPGAMLGHSVGEYVGACLAGVFSLEDGLGVLAARARLMAEMPAGSMLAVRLPEAELRPKLIEPIALAAINSPGLCVVSGPTESIEAFEKYLEAEKIVSKRLPTSHAFHSSMMDGVLPAFLEKLRTISLSPPEIPYVSSLTGDWITPKQATDPSYWCRQLREAVRFTAGVETLLEGPSRLCLEVGPGQTLSALIRQHPARTDGHVVLATLPPAGSERPELPAVQDALGQLWIQGLTPSWSAYFANETRQKIPLPTYPFEKTVYEITPEPNVNNAVPATPPAPVSAPRPPVMGEISGEWGVGSGEWEKRRERLESELTATLQRLSGIPREKLPKDATFIDLGFDSLFLTQVGQAFQKQFGVKITFRQLLEDFSSVNDLAAHLDTVLPPDPKPAAPQPPVMGENSPLLGPGESGFVEQVVQQQLALMQQQLELLRGGPTPTPQTSPPLLGAGGQVKLAGGSEPIKAFGPYKPLDKSSSALSDKQQAALSSLIARYVAKMPGSQKVTQDGRKHLADPRAVAGFKPAWKEMVFPVVTERSDGSRLWDIDGNAFIDITLGFGTNFLGHRPPFVVEALQKQLALGIEIGPQSALASQVAEKLCKITGMERAAFCNTGSEAVTAAIRMARTVTGRDKIALFAGAYHGQFDEVLVRAAGANSLPVAPGIPDSMVENVLVLEYGTDESLQILREQAHTLAAVLVEPVQSRRPEFQPREFAHELRKITEASGTALVFDEVVTGFRTHPGGMQARWGVRADIATYGKVLGGGFPIGVVTGRAEFMDALDGGFWSFGDSSIPEVGMTFFAGTFVRHPLALAAANAVLDHLLAHPSLQENLDARTEKFVDTLNAKLAELGAGVRLNRFSSMFFVQVPEGKLSGLLFYFLRLSGVHLWEGRPGFLSTVHTDDDIEFLVQAFEKSVLEMQDAGFLPSDRPRPTEAQREVWLAARTSDGASCALNESLSLKLTGSLDKLKLECALNEVIARHDALRTTFDPTDGTPRVRESLKISLALISTPHPPVTGEPERIPPITGGQGAIKTGKGAEWGPGETLFDLENGPLIRAELTSGATDDESTLILSAHHSVCDGWSFGVILHELAALYSGEILPPAPRFAEYAKNLDETRTPETLAYWKETLTPTPETLQLPTDRPHPPVRSYAGGRVSRPLEAETLEKLRALSRAHGTTLFTTLLAGLGAFLSRMTGQSDLVVGVPAAGQATDGAPQLVGHCVHLLPLRLRIEPDVNFSEQLKRTRTLVLDAFEHPNVTFGELVQALNLPREAGRVPLVGVTFNLDREGLPTHLGDAKLHVEKNPRRFFQFDLGFNLVETDAGISLEANYNSEVFDPETVTRWLGHYANLLSSVSIAPEAEISALNLLTEAESEQLLSWGTGVASDFPKEKSVGQVFAERAKLTPDALAVTLNDEKLTYAQLDQQSERVARKLVSQGVGVGDRVAVSLRRTPALIVALLGVLKAGAAYVPLDSGYPEERRALILKDSGARLEITETWLESLSDEPTSSAPLPDISGEALAYVMYTSGSTGVPKGVAIPHRAILRLVVGCDYAPLTPADVVAQAATPAFDAATFEIWGALLNGAQLAILPREATLEPARFAEALTSRKITTLFLTTALFNEIAREAPGAFASLKYLLFGGEASSPRRVQAVLQAGPPQNLLNVYGPTEATTFATFHRVTKSADMVPIGRPIASTTALILDETQKLVPVGVLGELFLGGPGLAQSYWNDDARTQGRFVNTPHGRLYKTGDRVRWSARGEIEFIGRLDGQLKLRGFRIEPGEIEAMLQTHPAIREARVIARPRPGGDPEDKNLVAYVVGHSTTDAVPGCHELKAFLEARLPAYLVPTAYVPLDALPLTASGKVDVMALPEPDPSCIALGGESVAPRTETERALARLWQEILGIESPGIDDDFFALGGHSLLAVRLFARIEAELGQRLPLATLFSAATISRQAALLTVAASGPAFTSLVPLNTDGARPRLFCVHHGYGDLTGYHELVRRLGGDQPVYGLQARGIDGVEEPLEKIEEMAAHYVAEIRAFQKEGPYHLTGFSLGGVIAFEMARQLRLSGQSVGMLALLDTYAPIFFQKGEKTGLLSEIASVAADLPKVAPGDRWKFAMNKGKVAGHRLKAFLQRPEAEPSGSPEEIRLRNAIRKVEAASRRALESYQPARYDGSAVVFRAEDGEIVPGYDPVLWWSAVVAGGVEVRELPGDHHAILQEPGVQLLADQLRRCLDDAQLKRD